MSEASRGLRWGIAIVATSTMAVSYVDRQTLSVLAPTVTKALALDAKQYGVLASAFSVAYLVGSPLAGLFVDRIGARRGLLGAVLVWSVVAALHALAPSFGVLVALRILLGLAESPSFPGAAQAVHRSLPPESRARGVGILFTGSSIGSVLAAPLSTMLEARFGFRGAFVGVAIVGLAWVPAWLAVSRRADARALLDGPVEAKASVPLRELVDPAILRAVLMVVSVAPTVGFLLLWGSKYLVDERHVAQSDVAKFLIGPAIAYDLGSVLFGQLAAQKRVSRPTLAILGGACVLAMLGVTKVGGPWAATALMSLALGGGGALFALLVADMLGRVSGRVVSAASGITAAAQSLAYIIANPLIGWSVDATKGYATATIALAIAAVPGVLVWALWNPASRS